MTGNPSQPLISGNELQNTTAHDRQQLAVFYLIIFFKDNIYLAIKKNEMAQFAATKTDLEIIILSEVRKRETDITRYHFYVES